MTLAKWDVCIAKVKYEDMDDEAVRPVVITDGARSGTVIVECLKMTGQPPRPGEYQLQKWSEAGLHKATVVRISKKLQLPQSKIIKRIGRLDPVDITGVEVAIQLQSSVAV